MSHKKCGCTQPCGCKDTGLPTPPVSNCAGSADCPNEESCPEIFDARCITYQGNPIVDIGINPGDRLDTIIQKLAMLVTNSGCILPTSACQSVLGLKSIVKTSTTLTVTWDPSATATQYTVEYKQASAMSFTMNPAVVPPVVTDTIGGLVPDTDYHIRVNTTCASGSCYSLTILVRTEPAT